MRARHLLLAATLPVTLLAQAPRVAEPRDLQLHRGLSGIYFRPQGELASLIGRAGGYGAHGILQIPGGPLGLRLDYRRIIYGAHSSEHSRYDQKAREWVDRDSSVTNNLRSFLIGPQLMLPMGAIRPYAGIAVGASIASTEWDVTEHRKSDDGKSACDNDESSDSTDFCIGDIPSGLMPNFGQILGGNWTGSFTRTIGVVIPIRMGRSHMAIDIGATEHRNGRTSLKREGDTRRYRSDLNFRTIQLGITLR